MSGSAQTFQLSTEAAEVYERKFVPALFAEWAEYVVEVAGIGPGHSVLDVACGTGVVARTAADRVGSSGRVAGVDLNEGMLAVARRIRPEIEWHHGNADDLPFASGSFDVALCQAALMYFPDRVAALREMARVVVDGGAVVAQVWDRFEKQPPYRDFAQIAARYAGPEALDLIGSYFSLGDTQVVTDLFREAGLRVTSTLTRTGAVRFASVNEFVAGEIEGSPLIDRIDDAAYERIRTDAEKALSSYVRNGRTEIPIEGHIVTGRVT